MDKDNNNGDGEKRTITTMGMTGRQTTTGQWGQWMMEHPPHTDEPLLIGWMAGAPRPYNEGPMPLVGTTTTTTTTHQHQQQGQQRGEQRGTTPMSHYYLWGGLYIIYVMYI